MCPREFSYGGRMRQVSARDAGYVYLPETVLSSRVLSCWVLAAPDGGPVDLTADRIVPVLADRLAVDDMFRSVLRRLPADIDLPYWVLDPAVDPADHITVHPPSGLTWPEAQAALAEIADRAFDTSRPLWSIDVLLDVTGIPDRSGAATILAVSFHHAAFDGMAWEHRMHTLLADEPVPHRAPVAIGPAGEPWALTVLRAVGRTPAVWSRFLRAAAGAAVETRRQARQVRGARALYDRRRAAGTRFDTAVRGSRTTDFIEFDLADVEALAAVVPGATTNDVLLSIVGDTLATHLTTLGEHPATSLICLVPKATRGNGAGASGPANQFVPLSVDMHTDIHDVVARVAAVARSSRAEKERSELVRRSAFWQAVLAAPAPLMRISGALARRRRETSGGRAPVNTVLSTIVNHTPVATVLGVPVVSGFAFSPLGGRITLAHLAVVGLGRVRLVATADSAVLPDLSSYMQTMRESLDRHRDAVARAGVASGGGVE